MLFADDFFGGGPLASQAFVQPMKGRCRLWVLVPKALDQLNGESRRQWLPLEGAQGKEGRLRFMAGCSQKTIGQVVGISASHATGDDLLGQAPQVLDEQDPKRDRDRPQLSDGERFHPLIGLHEPAQQSRIEPAVGMGNEGPGNAEDARVARQRAVCELRQLAIETRGQIVLDLADLIFDDEEIVHQPLGGRCDRIVFMGRLGDGAIGAAKDAFVVTKPGGERSAGGGSGRDPLRAGKALGVLLEALGAE